MWKTYIYGWKGVLWTQTTKVTTVKILVHTKVHTPYWKDKKKTAKVHDLHKIFLFLSISLVLYLWMFLFLPTALHLVDIQSMCVHRMSSNNNTNAECNMNENQGGQLPKFYFSFYWNSIMFKNCSKFQYLGQQNVSNLFVQS